MKCFNKIVILSFIFHGVLYYIFPGQHYNPEGWLVYIKYILFGLIIIICFRVTALPNFVIVGCIQITLAVFFMIGRDVIDPIALLLYLIPITALPLAQVIFLYFSKIDTARIAAAGAIVIGVTTILEFYFIPGYFPRMAIGGESGAYRPVSIFVNPNNLGVCAAFAVALIGIVRSHIRKEYFVFALLLLTTALILSGSKTGLVLVGYVAITGAVFFVTREAVGRSWIIGPSISVLGIISAAIGAGLGGGILFIQFLEKTNLRAFDLSSIQERFSQLFRYLSVVGDDIAFPGVDPTMVDNAYISIWAAFGLPVLVVFILFNVIIFAKCILGKRGKLAYLSSIILFAGCTINVFYIWPLAYGYWFLIGLMLVRKCVPRETQYR